MKIERRCVVDYCRSRNDCQFKQAENRVSRLDLLPGEVIEESSQDAPFLLCATPFLTYGRKPR
jgi:hypothetical protein